MGLIPSIMYETLIITPIEDFPNLVIELAETEKFMPKESLQIEELEDYCSTARIDTIRKIEQEYTDLVNLIPEPKEKFGQKLKRAFSKMPTLSPIFEKWEDIQKIETELLKQINRFKQEIQELRENLQKNQELEETSELVAKGLRLLETELPYEVGPNESSLIGVLTTTKIEDATEFCKDVTESEIIPLVRNKFMIYAKGKKEEITRLEKNLSAVRWVKFEYAGPSRLTNLEIEDELQLTISNFEEKNNELEKSVREFAIKNKEDIMALKLTIESYKHILFMYMSAKKTKKTVIFKGWVAEEDKNFVAERLAKHKETVIKFEEPEHEKKNIPIVEAKNPIMRSFQSIVGLYGLPSSKEIDPTIFFIITFSIFFGVMFGDAGHGLIFMIFGLLGIFARGLKKSVRQMFILVFAIGLSSFIMGLFVFGDAFGFHISHFLEESFNIHLAWYPLLNPVEDLSDIFNYTLIIGAGHIILGLVIRTVNQIRHKEFEELLKETGAQVFLYAAILYFLSSLDIINFGIDPSRIAIVGIISVSIGVGLALFGQGIASIILKKGNILRNFLGGIGMGIMNLLETFSSFISNTISYGRMLAMLIAHVVFLSVINTLAELSGFIVWQILILIIGNIFVIVLEGLLVFVQTLRLHFYEFFSKFYEGSGIQHKPIFIFNKEMDLNKYGI